MGMQSHNRLDKHKKKSTRLSSFRNETESNNREANHNQQKFANKAAIKCQAIFDMQ